MTLRLPHNIVYGAGVINHLGNIVPGEMPAEKILHVQYLGFTRRSQPCYVFSGSGLYAPPALYAPGFHRHQPPMLSYLHFPQHHGDLVRGVPMTQETHQNTLFI